MSTVMQYEILVMGIITPLQLLKTVSPSYKYLLAKQRLDKYKVPF